MVVITRAERRHIRPSGRTARQAKFLAKAFVTYLGLGILGLITAVPFVWMLISSVKTPGTLFIYPPDWTPNPVRLQNYVELTQKMPFVTFFANSTKIAILTTIGTLLSCSLAAYAFARFEFPGKGFIFAVTLSCLMVPYQVVLIPIFAIFNKLGLMDKQIVLWGPAFTGSAFGVFLLRQFFMTLPSELEDAALIDGASRFSIYWRIFLPLSQPALTTLAIFTFMGSWNDLLGPVLYLHTKSKMTLTVGIAMLSHQWGATPWHLIMAGAVVSVVPILAVYIAGQKYFVQGIVMTGLKM
ncbi:MAG: carbohydrate ABC transporter permease [Anaerolineae bacterium]